MTAPASRLVAPVPLALLMVAGGIVVSVAMGIRQSFGVIISPLSLENGWPLATFSFALALQNLLWGAAQPFAASWAERHGADKVALGGAVLMALGLGATVLGDAAWLAVLGSGGMIGLAQSATTHSVVLGVVGRAARPEKRSQALGVASAAGSVGPVVLVALAGGMLPSFGATGTIIAMAACALIMIPLALLLREPHRRAEQAGGLSAPAMGLVGTVKRAWRHGGFRLLTIGFFVCCFQVAFIGVHLPSYLSLCGLPLGLGATALIVIGLFNTAGSWLCGWLGGKYRPKNLLALIYLARGVLILAFVLAPKSEAGVLVFAALMGVMWLGTVPLTSGLIAQMFGTRSMGTLYGVVFFSHQIGSFVGVWAGGLLFDMTGSYDLVWFGAVALGVIAAAIHWPISDTPDDVDETLKRAAA